MTPIEASWRHMILREFTPQIARFTLVADPDRLLTEAGLVTALGERGFEIIEYTDPIAFRYAYESKYRSHWDRGCTTELGVILRTDDASLSALPFDLLHAGRQLSFSLGDLFPNLSYPVIAALDLGELDALYHAQLQQKPDTLGDNATKDFVLRHVFEIAPEFISAPHLMLRALLRRHYRHQRLPVILEERLVSLLRHSGLFDDWPLERIVPNREDFFAFLQERWPIYLDSASEGDAENVREIEASYTLQYSGPLRIPFDHDDVRVYLDNLFTEGMLRPVSHGQMDRLAETWVAVGLRTDPKADGLQRLERLMQSVQASVPPTDARHPEWLLFARRWAELTVMWHKVSAYAFPTGLNPCGVQPRTNSIEIAQQMRALQEKVDAAFFAWVQKRYSGLHNQPAVPPVMVHQIPRFLAHIRNPASTLASQRSKIALMVVDGLAFDQWMVLREVLCDQRPDLRFHEDAVFAWVPTITSVSRQAAFAGKPPLYFPSSIHTTDKERALWFQFWGDQGLTRAEVAYAKGLGDGSLNTVEEMVSHPKVCVVGLVVDTVDKVMHGMELGTAGMHNQVRQWAEGGLMARLLDLLRHHGFRAYLTADHGNIEAEGCGRPAEGVIADVRGERVRVYPDDILRARVKARFPNALEWPPLGLPEDFLPLLAPGRSAFIREGERIVGHGGISLEELVVPFVSIEGASCE